MMRAMRTCLKRWRDNAADRDGFTLVEVLVVLVIISVGILPLAMVQTRARQEVTEADLYTRAVTVAQRQLEWTKGRGFANAVSSTGQDGVVQWTTTVTDIDVGLRQIHVTVIFPQRSLPDTPQVASLVSMR